MPELPDLQMISKNLNNIYSNSCLRNIFLADKAKVNAPHEEYKKLLTGNRLVSITRIGKELKFSFENEHFIVLHLMKEGKLFKTSEDVKYIILKLEFEDHQVLVMNDIMGQAKVLLDPEISSVPDPFSPDFTMAYLRQKLAEKKRTAVKTFLTDQANLLGIGNAYADEILWKTRLSPLNKCGHIPDEIIDELYKNINLVLKNAVEKIEEAEPDIISGEIRNFLEVHNKDKKITSTGYEIQTVKVSGKMTYYTEEQILYQ